VDIAGAHQSWDYALMVGSTVVEINVTANTLTYYDMATIMAVNGVIVQAQGMH
jgi:hypothetical protein